MNPSHFWFGGMAQYWHHICCTHLKLWMNTAGPMSSVQLKSWTSCFARSLYSWEMRAVQQMTSLFGVGGSLRGCLIFVVPFFSGMSILYESFQCLNKPKIRSILLLNTRHPQLDPMAWSLRGWVFTLLGSLTMGLFSMGWRDASKKIHIYILYIITTYYIQPNHAHNHSSTYELVMENRQQS